jgi:hypothetical protein
MRMGAHADFHKDSPLGDWLFRRSTLGFYPQRKQPCDLLFLRSFPCSRESSKPGDQRASELPEKPSRTLCTLGQPCAPYSLPGQRQRKRQNTPLLYLPDKEEP